MATHGNRWSPDTCDCEILYNFDDETSNEDRVHWPVPEQTSHSGEKLTPKKCKYHDKTADHNEHYAVVLEENQRKNLIGNHIIDLFPHHTEPHKDGGTVLKEGSHAWSYDDNRVLHISSDMLTDEEKKILQSHTDQKHGQGKVVIH